MATVSVNPPKTPVTKGSSGIAAATVPNVCKMPGPPAPFVPTPLPNIGKSGDSPKGYSKKVKVEGQPVAIKGASFKSMGDIASKGTGGGIVSSNTHGPTKFIGPGSFDVKIEGKNVQYLGDPMVNNCGSPANSATTPGEVQGVSAVTQGGEDCPHEALRRVPALGEETRSPEELANSLVAEADTLSSKADKLAASMGTLTAADASAARTTIDGLRKGAQDKMWEAHVARETNAKEVSVKLYCAACGLLLGEFDVVTGNGTIKEAKSSGKAVDVAQFFKEVHLVQSPVAAPPNSVVHLAVPGDGRQRKAALNRFMRPGGRAMTNKGRGFNSVIQEH